MVTRLRARQFGILSLAGTRDFYPFQTAQIALGLHSAFCLKGDVVLLLGGMKCRDYVRMCGDIFSPLPIHRRHAYRYSFNP